MNLGASIFWNFLFSSHGNATVDLHLELVWLYCLLQVILLIMFVHSQLQQCPENIGKESYVNSSLGRRCITVIDALGDVIAWPRFCVSTFSYVQAIYSFVSFECLLNYLFINFVCCRSKRRNRAQTRQIITWYITFFSFFLTRKYARALHREKNTFR
jgi:hypothetical protein